MRVAGSLLILALTTFGATAFDFKTVLVPNVTDAIEQIEMKVQDVGTIPVAVFGPTTLNEVLASVCPGASPSYTAGFLNEVASENPTLFASAEKSLEADISASTDTGTIYVPYCLGAFAQRYAAQPGDSLWTIYEAQKSAATGVADWTSFQAEAVRLNGKDVLGSLPVGDVLVIPQDLWEVPVIDTSAGSFVDSLNQIEALKGLVILQSPKGGTVEAADARCAPGVPPEQVDLASMDLAEHELWSLAETLAFNAALDDKSAWQREGDTIEVVVLDNGLPTPATPVLRKVLRDFPLRGSASAIDDPLNFHGTGVLVTAIGGPAISMLNPVDPPVVAAAVNVFSGGCDRSTPKRCQFNPDANLLTKAMNIVADGGTDFAAINISVSFNEEPERFWEYIGPRKQFLIVTSAGNNAQDLEGPARVYPAAYGGNEVSNIITVGATNISRTALIDDSARSNAVIDIAAWGCNVPVVEFDQPSLTFGRQLRTGTSYAAPQVLFAAAMLMRERHRSATKLTGAQIKERIIVSADFAPSLWGEVKHGRVLNLAKTLSVHTDLIETRSGQLLRGQVLFDGKPEGEINLCQGQAWPREEVLNVVDLGTGPLPPAPIGT